MPQIDFGSSPIPSTFFFKDFKILWCPDIVHGRLLARGKTGFFVIVQMRKAYFIGVAQGDRVIIAN